MKIEKISEAGIKLNFIAKDIDASTANAVRRSVFEIPTIAIDTVEFYKNDSALYDEMIAHRLGLVPLKTEISMNEVEKCSCKGVGCAKCRAALKLKAKGPCTVYASDLKAKGVEVVYPEMPIVLLAADQELELSAETRLGKGKEHTKFNPGIIWYNVSADIKEVKTADKSKKSVKVPSNEFELIKQNKSRLIPDLIGETVECDGKFLEVELKNNDFVFFVEGFGQIKPKDIFIEAINALDANLEEFEKAVKKIK